MEQDSTRGADAQRAHETALLTAERERIAHELHQRVIHDLLALTLELDSIATRVHGEAQERLVELGRAVDHIAREVRSTVFGLTRHDGDDTPLGGLRPIMS